MIGSKATKDPKAATGPKAVGVVTLTAVERAVRAGVARGLPGLDAQLWMAPRPRVGWDPHVMPPGLRDAAGLLLAYPIRDEVHVLLTLRGSGLRRHTGQVSLPGGAVDPDESIEAAALREASEEVGIRPAAVRVLGRLTSLHIPVSGYCLHPVIGTLDHRPAFSPAEIEVARILEVPVAHLRDPGSVKRLTRTREIEGREVEIEVPYFEIEGEQVWGATAMVLAEFLALLEAV